MSKILPIIKAPNPILRKKSIDIKQAGIKSKKFKQLCQDMLSTMEEKDGVGLAAPQIGQNIRLVIINAKDGSLSLLNPKIKNKSWAKEWEEEGCLSVPDTYGEVKRSKNITCVYLNKQGKKLTLRAQGLLARVIQHEIDHLDGILFIDKAKNIKNISEN